MEISRAVLVVACAISAGIHGALVREHFVEGIGPGLGFLVATVLLFGLAAALVIQPSERWVVASATVMAGLIVSYVLAVTTGLPILHPDVEPVDGLALFTKSVEALGLLVTFDLLGRTGLHLHERTTK